jgi:hypothetical protein
LVPQNWLGLGYVPLAKKAFMMASVQSECSAKEVCYMKTTDIKNTGEGELNQQQKGTYAVIVLFDKDGTFSESISDGFRSCECSDWIRLVPDDKNGITGRFVPWPAVTLNCSSYPSDQVKAVSSSAPKAGMSILH